ncbi:MAG: hypothetical protein DMG11_23720 [Acidobacteria bacterium]|nr:MAG: hypothetical protein DMG11_23720 [Acidobacteriota bacterium]
MLFPFRDCCRNQAITWLHEENANNFLVSEVRLTSCAPVAAAATGLAAAAISRTLSMPGVPASLLDVARLWKNYRQAARSDSRLVSAG